MKRVLFICVAIIALHLDARGGHGDTYWNIEAGFLWQNTINASMSWEKELSYKDAVAIFGEAGDRFTRDPVCGKYCKDVFWDNYYWGGGVLYKRMMSQGRNSYFRIAVGPELGAVRTDFFAAVNLNFEWNFVNFKGIQFSLQQKNQVGFFNGDTFRNGLAIGVRIPF